MRMTRVVKAKVNRKQRGVALLIVIFALLLVSGIAIAMLGNANTETDINRNYRETQQAYFAAQGGIAEGIDRLKLGLAGATNGIPIGGMPAAGQNTAYIINKKSSSETVTPWDASNPAGYPDTELCKENFWSTGVTNNGIGQPCTSLPSGTSWYSATTSIAPFTGTSAAPDYKWVRITLKSNSTNYPYTTGAGAANAQVCSDGHGQETVITSGTCAAASLYPVYVITSLAVTPRGTRAMAQREVTQIILPPFPGALTLDGKAPPSGGIGFIPPFDAPNSNPFHVNGNNAAGCTVGGNHAAIAVVDQPTQNDVISEIPSNRYGNYTGSGSTTPDVQIVTSDQLGKTSTSDGWSTVAGVQQASQQLQSAAGANAYTSTLSSCIKNGTQVSSTSCADLNIGTTSNPQITFVNGDLTLTGNTTGAGILVVTGTLTITGNGGFQGIILVIGKGNFVYKGGGNSEFDGAILVAKTKDITGNLLPNLGEPVVDWSGGGGNGIYYNQCLINSVQTGAGFRTQSTRNFEY